MAEVSRKSQAFDDHSCDHGRSVYVPGWGEIEDADAIRVEKAGRAKSFKIVSDAWRIVSWIDQAPVA